MVDEPHNTPGDAEGDDGGENSDDGKAERPENAAIGSNFEEERLGAFDDVEIIKRLWSFMRPYALVFGVCLFLLPVVAGLELVQPHLLQVAIDQYLVPGKVDGLVWVIAAFGVAIVAKAAFEYLQFYLMQWAGQNALVDLRQEVFDHVQDRSVSFFHARPVGRLMTRMTTDIESLEDALSSGIITMIGDLLKLLGIVAILLWKDWRLALVSFTVVPFLVGLTAIFRYYLRIAFREIRTRIARLYAHLQESISGMHIIQMFVREQVSAEEYEDINVEYRNANFRSIRYDAMLYAVVEAVGSITVGFVIWYGSGQVLEKLITVGVLVAFIEYVQKFFTPIRDLAQKYNQLQSAIASAERIFQLLDTEESIPEPDDPEPLPERPWHIEFDDVWFAYNDEEWVLRDVSFEVNPGEKVALVGHTGAGKSTVIRLLARLYDVSRGSIRINGTDIREFDLEEYREWFAVVLQDVFLFNGTIEENLRLGLDCSEEKLREATEAVHADTIVDRYADGFDHKLAERGTNLSSGEKQLISFARALLRDPEVLILDEATANVDTETESLLQDAVSVLLERQTSIAIAHRLSTIENANRILVLDDGEIVERGSHRELLEEDGHYRTLYELQYAETPSLDASDELPSDEDPAAPVEEA